MIDIVPLGFSTFLDSMMSLTVFRSVFLFPLPPPSRNFSMVIKGDSKDKDQIAATISERR